MLTQRPAPRPYDVIALEVLLTLASALQAGLLLWLGLATWDDRGLTGTPVAGVLVVLAFALGIGWFAWLIGRGGWLLAATMAVTGVEAGFLWVLNLSGGATGISGTTLLFMVLLGIFGAICGAFLPAPSSRRYRPEPRVRPDAGAAAPPKITPSVARAADKYAKPAVVAASAVASAGAQKVSRGGTGTGSGTTPPTGAEPVLQPRPGTPIKTSGSVAPEDGTPAAGTASRAPATTPPAPAAQRPASAPLAPLSPTSPSRPDAAAAGAQAARTSPAPLSPAGDPGAIARSGRASIDAQLTPPAPAPKPSPTPGFRLVEPSRSTSLPPAGTPDLRYNPSGAAGSTSAAPRSAGATDPRVAQQSLPPVANPVPRPGGMAPPADAAGRAPLAPGDEPINGLPILGDPGEPPR